MRIAANLDTLYRELPFLERFGAAARDGFEGVECCDPLPHDPGVLAELLMTHGLELVLMGAGQGRSALQSQGLAATPGREAEFRHAVDVALANCHTLGCERLLCVTGVLPPDAKAANLQLTDLRATVVGNLRHAAASARAAHVQILVEPVCAQVHPGAWLRNTDQAMSLISEVDCDNVRLLYDIHHMQRAEGELTATLHRLLPHIGHIQFADAPGRHEPGTGEIRFEHLFRHLDTVGYNGWVGAEYRPLGSTSESLGWMKRAQA